MQDQPIQFGAVFYPRSIVSEKRIGGKVGALDHGGAKSLPLALILHRNNDDLTVLDRIAAVGRN